MNKLRLLPAWLRLLFAARKYDKQIKTLRVGNKIIILNGRDPIKYLDLTTDKVHVYKTAKTAFSLHYKVGRNAK